jgi:hypothetical protein
MNPANAFDTVMAQDLDDENKYVQVIIPNDGRSLKHGIWTWYRPGSTGIIKTETYFLNKIQYPKENKETTETTVKKEEPKRRNLNKYWNLRKRTVAKNLLNNEMAKQEDKY